jgi:hypothetical protein
MDLVKLLHVDVCVRKGIINMLIISPGAEQGGGVYMTCHERRAPPTGETNVCCGCNSWDCTAATTAPYTRNRRAILGTSTHCLRRFSIRFLGKWDPLQDPTSPLILRPPKGFFWVPWVDLCNVLWRPSLFHVTWVCHQVQDASK